MNPEFLKLKGKLTEENIELLEKKLKKHKTETEFVCEDCKRRFIGLNSVEKHIEKEKHYTYSSPEMPPNMRLAFL